MVDVAKALIGDRDIRVTVTGIRPGEKVHEIMVSEEEGGRTFDRGEHYAIRPMLPELSKGDPGGGPLGREYSSGVAVLSPAETRALLESHRLMVGQKPGDVWEFLR